MTEERIKINVSDKTEQLAEIRKGLGLSKANVILRPGHIPVNRNFSGDISEIFHRSNLLIDPKTKNPIFVYIRDHAMVDFYASPREMRKVHFMKCSVLMRMIEAGKFKSRYRMTNRTDDQYHVEFSYGREDLRRLYFCKPCLREIRYSPYLKDPYRAFLNRVTNWDYIASELKAKDALDMLWQIFNNFRQVVERADLNHAVAPAGYVRNWKEVSEKFRGSRNYTCDKCNVNLSATDTLRGLVDAHHKDGDKRNNSEDNLECLCKLCHEKEHPHYKVDFLKKSLIERARKEQGIS